MAERKKKKTGGDEDISVQSQNGVTEALRYANVAVKAGNAQGGLTV